MTTLLSITAPGDAAVACDMSGAEDTLVDRLAEYRRLFEQALVTRESTETSTTLAFADRPGIDEWVLDLVRREAACCPFLSYEVVREDGLIRWTTTGLGEADIAVFAELFPQVTVRRRGIGRWPKGC